MERLTEKNLKLLTELNSKPYSILYKNSEIKDIRPALNKLFPKVVKLFPELPKNIGSLFLLPGRAYAHGTPITGFILQVIPDYSDAFGGAEKVYWIMESHPTDQDSKIVEDTITKLSLNNYEFPNELTEEQWNILNAFGVYHSLDTKLSDDRLQLIVRCAICVLVASLKKLEAEKIVYLNPNPSYSPEYLVDIMQIKATFAIPEAVTTSQWGISQHTPTSLILDTDDKTSVLNLLQGNYKLD